MSPHTPPPALLTALELASVTAGGDSYIRTKNNHVKGLALTLELNPDAPEVVVVGDGPRIIANANLLFKSQAVVPAYIKRATNSWEYLGKYRATAFCRDKKTIEEYRHHRLARSVAGILFLEEVDKPMIEIRGGGYADPQTRREVEQAAIVHVTRDLESKGFVVKDRQRENCGYDLLAISKTQSLKVEVKGTDAVIPRFFITKNERSVSKMQTEWRLALVCSARSKPKMSLLTANEMEKTFEFDALAWECKTRES